MSKLTKHLRTIVTGGSGALGAAIISALEKRGDKLVNLDKEPNGAANWIELDLADNGSVKTAVDTALVQLGGVDVLIHAAGIFHANPFLELSDEQFGTILNINLLGSFRVAQSVAYHMQNAGGRILFISSIHAQHGVEGRLAYGASKAGIEAMTRVIAAELSHRSIRVNALAPGAVSTGVAAEGKLRSNWDEVTPAGRKVTAEEVADLAVLLTSDGASFVSGQVISQDGGASTAQIF